MELTIDKAGRVVIPKPVRDDLRLQAGDVLDLSCEGETLHLTPVRAQASLRKKGGMWVYRGESKNSSLDIDAAIDDMREERIRDLSR